MEQDKLDLICGKKFSLFGIPGFYCELKYPEDISLMDRAIIEDFIAKAQAKLEKELSEDS